jgi:hypothetical protein
MDEQELAEIVNELLRHRAEGSNLAEAATRVREQHPNLSAIPLAQALVMTTPSTPIAMAMIAPGGEQPAANPTTTSLDHPIEIAAALKGAGYSANDIAPAIVGPGAYPSLTAYQLGQVLMAPAVFPATTRDEMRAALQAANFSPADIDAAIAQLFPAPKPTYRKIGPVGITTDPFDDTDAVLKLNKPLTRLFIRSGTVLDSFEVYYGGNNRPLAHHGGGMGDSRANIDLRDDYITKVSGFYGGYHGGHCMLQLTFQTKKGKTYGPYGNMWDADPNRTPFTLEANENEKVIAFFGTANWYLCSIGITVQTI